MKQILIVEDDSFLNKMLAYNLTADGYGVTSALNARTAAEAIRQREFDLVLLDINLPDGNGFELCKLIKPQHPDTIVIFLTANDQESDQIRGYEVGAVDYITKPFEEFDNDTLKNLVTVPVNRTKLVLSKMLVLLLFAVGFMAVGGLVNLAVLLFQGWEPVGFWTLFGVGIEEGLIMWVGALPCILLVVLLNKNYIVSVVITFFYTIANSILSTNDMFLTQPFGLNIGTLFPGPLAFRWTFQFYDQSQTSAELADLLERVSPYFLNGVQVFGVIIVEAIVFLALIAFVYRRQEI